MAIKEDINNVPGFLVLAMLVYAVVFMLSVAQVLGGGQNNSLYQRGNARAKYNRSYWNGVGSRRGSLGGVSGAGLRRGMGGGNNTGIRNSGSVVGSGVNSGDNDGMDDSNDTSALKASWCTVAEPSPKDFQVHDLVTIVVQEISKHYVKADTTADRKYSINSTLSDWIHLTKGRLVPDVQAAGDPTIGFTTDKKFKGKGDIKREDTLTARIQAEIIDIMPNGNLVLEATHSVVADDETTYITLTGVCRSKDVGISNTILSSQLADLKLTKKHTGIARDTEKRGWLAALIDFLSPF